MQEKVTNAYFSGKVMLSPGMPHEGEIHQKLNQRTEQKTMALKQISKSRKCITTPNRISHRQKREVVGRGNDENSYAEERACLWR